MKAILDWILARGSENSTWRGLIALVASTGVAFSPEQSAAIVAVGLAAIGLINVFRSEK